MARKEGRALRLWGLIFLTWGMAQVGLDVALGNQVSIGGPMFIALGIMWVILGWLFRGYD